MYMCLDMRLYVCIGEAEIGDPVYHMYLYTLGIEYRLALHFILLPTSPQEHTHTHVHVYKYSKQTYAVHGSELATK